MLAAMTFRTTEEAVELANNTRYGLAASVWSENINLALHVAPQLKAGVVWINGTNMFDAACGFGGYRESGFGREGGARGHVRISRRKAAATAPAIKPAALRRAGSRAGRRRRPAIDRTAKLFIGGKQVRPDGNYSYPVLDRKGRLVGEAGLGNRKDIRDAVSAARACKAWAEATAYNRSQVLYFLAENLSVRADEFAARLIALTGAPAKAARAEVDLSVERLFCFAGMADKFEGRVHQPPARAVTLALHEPVGVRRHRRAGRRAAARPDLAGRAGAGHGQHGGRGAVARDIRCSPPTSTRSSNIPTCRPARSTSSPARRPNLPACWPSTTMSTGCGSSPTPRPARRPKPSRSATSSASGPARATRSTGTSEQFSGDSFLRRAVEVKNVWVPYGD